MELCEIDAEIKFETNNSAEENAYFLLTMLFDISYDFCGEFLELILPRTELTILG